MASLADIGAYLLAAIGVAAVAIWALMHRRASRGDATNAGTAAQPLTGMLLREFETLVTEGFRRQGYQVVEPTRGGMGSGGELTLRRDRETFLVQCKHWQASKVGIEPVHAMQRAMAARGAAGGFVLTGGRFGREAVAFASGCNVRLIDGPALRGLLEKAKAARSTT